MSRRRVSARLSSRLRRLRLTSVIRYSIVSEYMTVFKERATRAAMSAGLLGFVASSRVRANPYPLYRTAHRLDPNHRSFLGVLVLTSHAEVAAALRDPRLGNDEDLA